MRTKKIQPLRRKLGMYFAILWKKLDALAITLFYIATIVRFLPMEQSFCTARAILAIDLAVWFIRMLDVFSAVKRLGPKLVMIGEMVRDNELHRNASSLFFSAQVHDLTFFMLMLALVILAFGVPTYSLLNGVENFSWHIPRKILNLAYWDIFGEVQAIDDIESRRSVRYHSRYTMPLFASENYGLHGYVMFILLVAYTTVTSVLLINLLIAMFRYDLHVSDDVLTFVLFKAIRSINCIPMPIAYGSFSNIH